MKDRLCSRRGRSMTKIECLLGKLFGLTVTVFLFFAFCLSALYAQTKQSETAESLGLGGASRFETGYSPIVIDRTKIIPGVPFNVKPTMDNLVSTSKTSMGGILNRFDTSKFGQMFSSAISATGNVAVSRAAKAAPAAPPAVVTSKLYPPRIALDESDIYTEEPAEPSSEVKKRVNQHLRELFDRYPLKGNEQVVLDFEGNRLILRGQVESAYIADVLVLTMEMEPGIDEVVNEIVSTAE